MSFSSSNSALVEIQKFYIWLDYFLDIGTTLVDFLLWVKMISYVSFIIEIIKKVVLLVSICSTLWVGLLMRLKFEQSEQKNSSVIWSLGWSRVLNCQNLEGGLPSRLRHLCQCLADLEPTFTFVFSKILLFWSGTPVWINWFCFSLRASHLYSISSRKQPIIRKNHEKLHWISLPFGCGFCRP